jgi:hypothetical protein
LESSLFGCTFQYFSSSLHTHTHTYTHTHTRTHQVPERFKQDTMLVFRNALKFHDEEVAKTEDDRRIRDFARFLERAFTSSYNEHYHSEALFQKRLEALKDGRREPDLNDLEKEMLKDREERSKYMSELLNFRKFMGEINKVHKMCTCLCCLLISFISTHIHSYT